MNFTVLERSVVQHSPEVLKQDYEVSNLLKNSNKSWSDIQMVYRLCEVRQVAERSKKKFVKVIGLYFQGHKGKNDYKYIKGLNFLIPVRNVHKEIMEFMEGGWSNFS